MRGTSGACRASARMNPITVKTTSQNRKGRWPARCNHDARSIASTAEGWVNENADQRGFAIRGLEKNGSRSSDRRAMASSFNGMVCGPLKPSPAKEGRMGLVLSCAEEPAVDIGSTASCALMLSKDATNAGRRASSWLAEGSSRQSSQSSSHSTSSVSSSKRIAISNILYTTDSISPVLWRGGGGNSESSLATQGQGSEGEARAAEWETRGAAKRVVAASAQGDVGG